MYWETKLGYLTIMESNDKVEIFFYGSQLSERIYYFLAFPHLLKILLCLQLNCVLEGGGATLDPIAAHRYQQLSHAPQRRHLIARTKKGTKAGGGGTSSTEQPGRRETRMAG